MNPSTPCTIVPTPFNSSKTLTIKQNGILGKAHQMNPSTPCTIVPTLFNSSKIVTIKQNGILAKGTSDEPKHSMYYCANTL
jgi:hypothetical protein